MIDKELIRVYSNQYRILERRMLEASEYVSIDKDNYPIFSSFFISMFISVCSEIDSLSGELAQHISPESGIQKKGIIDKLDIIQQESTNLKNKKVETLFLYGKISMVPFAKLKQGESSWWKDYNVVKHNRTEKDDNGNYNYEKANLKNVLHALAGLYLLLSECCRIISIMEMPFESELFSPEII